MKTNLEKLGAAQAAVLSAMVGVVTLAMVNLGTVLSENFKTFVFSIGKIWMPGAEGIGPYSGGGFYMHFSRTKSGTTSPLRLFF